MNAKYGYKAARAYGAPRRGGNELRDRIIFGAAAFAFIAMAIRLGQLQIAQAQFFRSLASGQHDIFSKLLPTRGDILVRDRDSGSLYPVASNRDLWIAYSDNRKLSSDPAAEAAALAPLLAAPPEAEGKKPEELAALQKEAVKAEEEDLKKRLSAKDDPYEQLGRYLPEDAVEKIKALAFTNVGFAAEKVRTYPESGFGGQLLGFVGYKGKEKAGLYGLEGYWDKQLAGTQGYLRGQRDPAGGLIGANASIQEKTDGSSLILTVDRTVQAYVCSELAKWAKQFNAEGGSAVMIDPKTGAVIAMCGAPDFDPNSYGKAESAAVYNNPAIWHAYEPGSVMKPITMAAAIDSGAVMPSNTYTDTGEERYGSMVIRNSDHQAHGVQTMVDVLDKSLNTGAIFAMRKTGVAKFNSYLSSFGFGMLTGIELDTEAPGNLSSLKKNREVDAATASFGQGITATPLQLAVSYAAIANSGKIMKPYVVDALRHPDGSETKTTPQMVRQVISEKTASLVTGMLVSVVKNGHGKRAGVPGYLVAGKTGTAQIPKSDGSGYDETATIGTFAGFAPVSNPKFALVVRIDRPQGVEFAESSVAPLWGDIASFALRYFEVPPDDTR